MDRGLQGRPDHEVMALAQNEGRVLISADTDFGELIIRNQKLLPSLILLRGLTSRTPELASVILENLDQIVEELIDGAIVVFTTEHIRVRRLGPDAEGN
jgi:predicted nuclease of predicted toxin-antitoxin system